MLQNPKFERSAGKPIATDRTPRAFMIAVFALWAGLCIFAIALGSGTPPAGADSAALYGP